MKCDRNGQILMDIKIEGERMNCRRCYRRLTDPVARAKGIGPVCEQKEKAAQAFVEENKRQQAEIQRRQQGG